MEMGDGDAGSPRRTRVPATCATRALHLIGINYAPVAPGLSARPDSMILCVHVFVLNSFINRVIMMSAVAVFLLQSN